MGVKTDEFEATKAELLETEIELKETENELKVAQKSVWIQRAKAIAIVIGALATLVTAILAHFQPEEVAEKTAGAAAVSIRQLQAAVRQQDIALQGALKRCQEVAASGVAETKAEADSVRQLLLGYLLGGRGRKGRGPAELRKSLGAVVKQMGGIKRRFSRPSGRVMVQQRVKLAPPVRLENLSKRVK